MEKEEEILVVHVSSCGVGKALKHNKNDGK